MLTLDAGLASHVTGRALSLTVCWTVTRKDGLVLRGTAHDRDITIESGAFAGTYPKRATIYSTDIASKSDGSVSNTDVEGAFFSDVDELTVADVEGGLFDQARAVLFMVNWADPNGGQKILLSGRLGEFYRDSDGRYRSEVRSLTQALAQNIGETYSERCSVKRFGDARCKFDVASATRTGTITQGYETTRRMFDVDIDAGPVPPTPTYFNGGIARFTSGAMENVEREIRALVFPGASSGEWQPNHTYEPGAIIVSTAGSFLAYELTNATFEDGDTGWTWGGGGLGVIEEASPTYAGTWRARSQDTGSGSPKTLTNNARIKVVPGEPVTVRCRVYSNLLQDRTRARIEIAWFDSSGTLLSTTPMEQDPTRLNEPGYPDDGRQIRITEYGLIGLAAFNQWTEIEATGAAPSGAASYTMRLSFFWMPDGSWLVDAGVVKKQVMLRAIQSEAATSGATEPDWPSALGETVADGDVTWEVIDPSVQDFGTATVLLWDETPLDVEIGGTVEIEPGCDRAYDTCRLIHKNLVNFRGHGVFAVGRDALMRGATSHTGRIVTKTEYQWQQETVGADQAYRDVINDLKLSDVIIPVH